MKPSLKQGYCAFKAVHFRLSFQWHLSDQKVILLIILYQQAFKNVYTSQTSGPSATVPKLEGQIFGTVGIGPEVGTLNFRNGCLWFQSLVHCDKNYHFAIL